MAQIVVLPGFGGTKVDFEPFFNQFPSNWDFQYLALPGHEGALSCDWLQINNLEDAGAYYGHYIRKRFPDSFVLGYSLGGRIATAMLPHFQGRGLILLSSGIGLSPEERPKRQLLDDKWAKLLRESSDDFWPLWFKQDLFAGFSHSPVQTEENLIASRSIHNSAHLAETISRLSPSRHELLLPLLQESKKLLYFAGEGDKKYAELAEHIRRECKQAQVHILPNSGHCIHLEQPKTLAQHIKKWIEENS